MRVRAYQVGDRELVREICHLTGHMGEPADWFWADRDSFADLFSGYWTDREPESALVVEAEPGDEGAVPGQVVGYLLGCVDSTRVPSMVEVLWPHVWRRGLLWRRGTARTVWRGVLDVTGDLARTRRLPEEEFSDPRYPSHLHIDLLPVARGRGLGRELVQRFLDRLRSLGSPGCHVQTLAENRGAVAFFRSVGFVPLERGPAVPAFRSRDGGRLHLQVMVQALD
jgi:GNAT superfamily N-acetyltransferase